MTTGRINQVTTLAADERRGAATSAPRNRSETESERGAVDARTSFNVNRTCASVALTNSTTARPFGSGETTTTHWQAGRRSTTCTLRLPNTRCEVGIYKTVERVSKLYKAETIVPDRLKQHGRRAHHLKRARGTFLSRASSTEPAWQWKFERAVDSRI